MDNNLAIILLPLIVMIIVYSFVLGVSVKRCLKLVFEKNKSVFYGKIFYANIFILCIIRIALYLVLIFKFDDSNDDINDNQIDDLILYIFWIPTLLVAVAFFILLCQLNIMFFHSRLDIDQINYSQSDIKIQQLNQLRFKISPRFYRNSYYGIILFWILHLVFWILYSTKKIDKNCLIIEQFIFDFSIPLLSFFVWLTYKILYSGTPSINDEIENQYLKFQNLTFLWGFGRLISGMYYLIQETYFHNVNINSDIKMQLLRMVMIFANYFFSEIVPIFFALENNIIDIFTKFSPEYNSSILIEQDSQAPLLKSQQSLDQVDVSIQKQNGLGIIKHIKDTNQQDNTIIVRQIKENITRFIMDDVFKDFQEIKDLSKDHVVPLLNFYHDKEELCISYELQQQSLYNFMENNKNTSLKVKLNLIYNLLKSLQYLHSKNYAHGHLTPENIFVQKNQVKIQDFGFQSLKNFMSYRNYKNKSCFSSPEVFNQRGDITKNVNPQQDIYSISMIIWYIFSNKQPYEGLDLQSISNAVKTEKRPKIQESIPEQISLIIQSNWQQEPQNRMSLEQIKLSIENFAQSQKIDLE